MERYTARHASGVNDRYALNILFKVDHMPNASIQSILHLSIHLSYLEESFCLDVIYSAELPKSRLLGGRRQDVATEPNENRL